MRHVFLTILKLAVVAALLWWLVQSGKLDFGQLGEVVQNPTIVVANVALWSLGYVVLGGFRWWLLLRGLDLEMPFIRTLRLQLIGFFFNTAMPGAVGGDIVKAVYVIREQHSQRKTPAMLTILIDRVVGLVGLFVLAGLSIGYMLEREALRPLALFVGVGLLGFAVGAAVLFYPFPEGKDPIARLLSAKLPGFSLLHSIYQAARSYRRRKRVLLAAVGISMVIQVGGLLYAWYLTQTLTSQTPAIGELVPIYTIGVMTTALPLAPGGLGVGHVAFDRLFHLAGLTGGANVFNVMVLGQLILNLFGFIPYVLHRTKLPDMAELQSELAAEAATAQALDGPAR